MTKLLTYCTDYQIDEKLSCTKQTGKIKVRIGIAGDHINLPVLREEVKCMIQRFTDPDLYVDKYAIGIRHRG